MLRRPPTTISITADDLAAFEVRHQARIAAHARSLTPQREQAVNERDNRGARDDPLPQTFRADEQEHHPPRRQVHHNAAAPVRTRRQHAPGAFHTGSPGGLASPTDGDSIMEMGMHLDGATADEDEDEDEDETAEEVAVTSTPDAPSRVARNRQQQARADAEQQLQRRRQLERERILGRGHHGSDTGGPSTGSTRRPHAAAGGGRGGIADRGPPQR